MSLNPKIGDSGPTTNTAKMPRIPTTASPILKELFDVEASAFGKQARVLLEFQTPVVQGDNAYYLSTYIVDNIDEINKRKAAIKQEQMSDGDIHSSEPEPDIYKAATFFKNMWESNNCYICGTHIDETVYKGSNNKPINSTMELEHVLPMGEALALTAIIPDNKTEFKKKLQL